MKTQTKFKQTEIGKIPEDWEIGNLIDISDKITDGSHFSPSEDSQGTQIIATVKDMKRNGFDFSECKAISEEDFVKLKKNGCSPEQGDILISKDGAKCLDIIFVYNSKREIVLLSSIAIVRLKEENDPNFYRYYLLSPSAQKIMKDGFVSGSAIPRVILNSFKKVPIPLLPRSEQQRISKILSDLDAKIELNNQMNKTLEAIGQTLFQKWFVNERKDEWDKKKLGDIVECIKGVSYRSEELKESENALVTLKSITRGGGFNQKGYKEYSGEFKDSQILANGDIVVAQTDLTQNAEVVGRPALVIDLGDYVKLIASLDLQIIRPKKGSAKWFLYFLLKTEDFHNHALSYVNGTTVLHLGKGAVQEYGVDLPDEKTLKNFHEVVEGLMLRLQLNTKQNQILSEIRDALLPKLMNGEIRVK